jgi:hypothetical protein
MICALLAARSLCILNNLPVLSIMFERFINFKIVLDSLSDFPIQNSASFKKKDFMMKREGFSKNKVGQRKYLNNSKTTDLTSKLYSYFESMVEIPRMKHGRRQTVETLINEEAFLFAQYLRDEHDTWIPRISNLN